MIILISLGVALLISFLLRNPIKTAPWAFFALACTLSAAFILRDVLGLPTVLDRNLFLVMQKCTLAESFFIVVMFMGCLSRKSKARQWLNPIRAQLSIIACILCAGHVVAYISSYFVRFISGALPTSVALSIALAAVLILAVLVLGTTSFNFARKRMKPQTWKRLQWCAYPFFILTLAHALLLLVPAALAGNSTAQLSALVYAALLVAYMAMRLARLVVDRGEAKKTADCKSAAKGEYTSA